MSEDEAGGGGASFHETAAALKAVVAQARPRLERMDPAAAGRALREGGWSAQQVLGHLIDSAVVNQQRLIRARLEGELEVLRYDQNGWVDAQRVDRRPWGEVIELWAALNTHLAHVLEMTPPSQAPNPCRLDDGEVVSLGFLASDYVAHQRHHLASLPGVTADAG